MDAVSNFPNSLVVTAPSPATTGTTLGVTAGQGVLYPTPPFNLVLTVAGAAPSLSASEIVRCTAIATDTLTIIRAQEGTTAQTVVVGWQVYATATKNTWSQIPSRVIDAVVAPSGGDYTTLGAALTAGARSILVRRGTYTETVSTSTVWTGTTPITITGEDREQTIIQLAASATGYLNINIAGSYISNLTVKPGAFSLADTTTNGWLTLSGTRCLVERINIIATGSAFVGTSCIVSADSCILKSVSFSGGAPSGGNIYAPAAGTKLLMDDVNIVETRNVASIFANGNYTTLSNSYITSSAFTGYVVGMEGYYTNTVGTTIINTLTAVSSNNTFDGGGSFASLVACTIISTVNAILINYRGTVSGCLIDISSTGAAQSSIAVAVSSDGQSVTGNVIVGGANSTGGIQISTDSICEGNYISGFTKSGAYAINGGSGVLGINYIENCSVWYQDAGNGKSMTQVQKFSMRPFNAAGAVTVDVRQYNGAIVNLLTNSTISFTEDSLATGSRIPMIFEMQIVQDATGSRLVTWPASVHWAGGTAPVLSTGANKRDIVSFRYEPISGFYYGSVAAQNFS